MIPEPRETASEAWLGRPADGGSGNPGGVQRGLRLPGGVVSQNPGGGGISQKLGYRGSESSLGETEQAEARMLLIDEVLGQNAETPGGILGQCATFSEVQQHQQARALIRSSTAGGEHHVGFVLVFVPVVSVDLQREFRLAGDAADLVSSALVEFVERMLSVARGVTDRLVVAVVGRIEGNLAAGAGDHQETGVKFVKSFHGKNRGGVIITRMRHGDHDRPVRVWIIKVEAPAIVKTADFVICGVGGAIVVDVAVEDFPQNKEVAAAVQILKSTT